MRSKPVLGYSILFFLSGATGLVYELLWVRLLYQAFGSTIQSVTTVVAAYMGGLGLGAWLLGRRADREPRPAALYGRLELLIGVFGIVSPFVLGGVQRLYVALASGLPEGSGVSVALRFGLAGLVLLVPTTLMGGTLPVLTRAFTATDRGRLRHSLGRLYGLNTLGAVLGTALAGFVLIEKVGIRAGLWGTAILNFAIGAAALLLAPPAEPAGAPRSDVALPTTPARLRRVAVVLLAVTAFAALLNEIAWTRALVMVVGGSTYAFTLVLFFFLLGIGLGSAVVARRNVAPLDTAATGTLAIGITVLGATIVLVALSSLANYILIILQRPFYGAAWVVFRTALALAVVLLPATIGMGMTFPLLTDLAARPDEASARDVGRAYSLNTIGSIVGAVLTGFVLVVAWGTDWTLRLGLAVTSASGLALAIATVWGVPEGSAEHKRLRTRALGGALLASVGLAGAFAVPHWSTRLIDLGPTIYGRGLVTRDQRALFLQHAGLRQLAFHEGRNSTISVWESAAGRNLKVNGKVDASDFGDMDTQVMLALAPVVFHPHARAALAVGFGSGVTTATLAAAPGMDRVRVVELEPAVLSVAPLFREVNGDVLQRPNVRPIVDDARSALQLSRDTYDVIVSEPSNPWVAGVATLYTTEFYRIVQRRLTPGGVFCQWVQLYQLPLPVVAGIVRNVHAVFPHVEVYFGGTADLMVLGSDHSFAIDSTWLAQVIGPGAPLARSAHEYLGLDSPAQFADRRVLGETGVARLITRATLTHHDDRPELEFVAARNFLRAGASVPLDSLVEIGVAAGERPALQVGLARVIGTPLGEPDAYPYVLPLHRAHPADDEWTVALAAIGIRLGDSTLADSTFPRILKTTRNPELLLLAAEMAVNRKLSEAGPLLARALAGGADTAAAEAAGAVIEGRREHWAAAAAAIRAAIKATHNTYRSPFPRDQLEDVLRPLALKGPPPLADSVLAEVIAARPGWAHAHEWRAAAALREHKCQEAADQFVELVDFGIFRDDGPALVSACQQNR